MVRTLVTQSRMASLMASFRVFEPDGNAAHFGAQQAHAENVEFLARHVDVAHVDDAFHPKQRADGGGGNAVLPRAGLGDDALFAHALGEQALAEGVVDFVRAGVEQVFALEVDSGAAEIFGEAFGEVERRGAAGVILEQSVELGLESGIGLRDFVFVLEFQQRGHQGLRHIAPAVRRRTARGATAKDWREE